jgi:hypothetical protein
MTMAERLRWLDEMVQSMRQIQGKAMENRRASPDSGTAPGADRDRS